MTRTPARRRRALAATAALATAALHAACSTGSGAQDDGRLQVLASFYPLQYVAEQVGGDLVSVSNLTPPAAEPHDLELAPAQVRAIGTADLVVYQSGFQAAVDEGVAQRAPEHVVDATEAAGLEEHPGSATADGHEGESAEEHAEHAEDDGHDHGSLDPHFWLDPTRLPAVADDVAAQLAEIDPDHADEFQANAEAFAQQMAD